jgi:hypothetical protein
MRGENAPSRLPSRRREWQRQEQPLRRPRR